MISNHPKIITQFIFRYFLGLLAASGEESTKIENSDTFWEEAPATSRRLIVSPGDVEAPSQFVKKMS